ERAVDLAYELLDLRLELVILRDIDAARHHHLDERNALAQLRVTVERDAERLQAMRYAFRIVEAIDPEYQLPVRKQAMQLVGTRRNFRRCRLARESAVVDADRKIADP